MCDNDAEETLQILVIRGDQVVIRAEGEFCPGHADKIQKTIQLAMESLEASSEVHN